MQIRTSSEEDLLRPESINGIRRSLCKLPRIDASIPLKYLDSTGSHRIQDIPELSRRDIILIQNIDHPDRLFGFDEIFLKILLIIRIGGIS